MSMRSFAHLFRSRVDRLETSLARFCIYAGRSAALPTKRPTGWLVEWMMSASVGARIALEVNRSNLL